jgi:hypothetical protein
MHELLRVPNLLNLLSEDPPCRFDRFDDRLLVCWNRVSRIPRLRDKLHEFLEEQSLQLEFVDLTLELEGRKRQIPQGLPNQRFDVAAQ